MEKYYLIRNNEREGPFSLEEIRQLAISTETLIWKEGMKNWTKAENFSELEDLFKSNPPPIPTNNLKNIKEDKLFEKSKKNLEKKKVVLNSAKFIKNILLYLISIAAITSISYLFLYHVIFEVPELEQEKKDWFEYYTSEERKTTYGGHPHTKTLYYKYGNAKRNVEQWTENIFYVIFLIPLFYLGIRWIINNSKN